MKPIGRFFCGGGGAMSWRIASRMPAGTRFLVSGGRRPENVGKRGQARFLVTGEANANPFQYTGRENDGTGLYYYRARYYDPGLKRFVSEDPIGLAGGINTYEYVSGSPVNYKDSLGLQSIPPDLDPSSYSYNPNQDPAYGSQPYDRGLNPYERCMLKCLARKAGEKAVESAAEKAVPYIALAGAAAAGEPGVAVVIQAVRQIVARVERRIWPIAAVYYPTKWFYECEDECGCLLGK